MKDMPFTRLPTKLIYILDSDLLKMLSILIQQEDYWNNAKKLENDGSFYKTMNEFADIFRKKNLQDVRLMLQTLQSEKLIEIIPSKTKKQANYYRVNWERIEEYNNFPIPQLIQSPMIKTTKRVSKKKVEGSTETYQQSDNSSTELYRQDSDLIVQDCTSTINNNLNKENNLTIENIEITKSANYELYKTKLEELLEDYQQELDYVVALEKYTKIEEILKFAEEHIPMSEIDDYCHQLSEAKKKHERSGWNINLDMMTEDMMQSYNISNIHNIITPRDFHQFTYAVNDLLSKAELYIDSDRWEDLAEKVEKWITHQWERNIISNDHKQEAIEKVYSKLVS